VLSSLRGRRLYLSILIGAATLGAVGCGSSSSSSTTASTASTATTTPATTPATTATTTSTATTTESSQSGVTPPSASLSIGATATVPYAPVGEEGAGKPTFKLQYTVLSITKGSLSDFNGIKLEAVQKASTPDYVKVKITNVGPGNADAKEVNPSIDINGVDSTGETQQSVTFLGDFPKCEDKEAPKPFTTGKSYETCLTFLIPGGISKAAYTGGEAYDTTPIIWH
jgi:hypothetical protein